MSPPVRFVLTRDGIRIAYAVHGSGPPLVFVRGWISHLGMLWEDPEFRPFFEAVGEHFTVVRYDMRGNGLSDRDVLGRLDLDALALDLEAVMDKLGLEQPIIWATCYGGPIVARYLFAHPERVSRLVLDGTYARGAELSPPQVRDSILGVVRMLDEHPGATHALLDYYTNPEPNDPRQISFERTRGSIKADVASELYALAFALDVSDELSSIRVPSLVVHRRRSAVVPFRLGQQVAALLPDASLVTLEGRAHNPWEGNAIDVLAAVGDFLGSPIAASLRRLVHSGRPTVILFTDIEGSTSATSRLGDERAQELVRTHNRIIATALERRQGRRVKSTGDGVMAAFPSVTQALQCAVDIQQALAEHNNANPDGAVRVRVGINAGEPLAEDDELHGLVVSTTSRICDQAKGGEVLVSNVVQELARGKGFTFREAGVFDLRGVDEPVRLFTVAWQEARTGNAGTPGMPGTP